MSKTAELAFLHFEVADLALWHTYAHEVLGLHVEDDDGGFRARLDDRAARLYFSQGPRDDLVLLGWQLPSPRALDDTLAHLAANKVDTTRFPAPQRYHASALWRLRDPANIPVALVLDQDRTAAPLDLLPGHQGFVAGDLGLGHVVLRARDKAVSTAFHQNLLGLQLSDHIVTEVAGYPVDLSFFHTPGTTVAPSRHHSLAVGGMLPKRLHHFMLECRSVDDVGACYDRMVRLNLPIFQTLGRHPNDGMLSFYAVTPSGFQVEVGFGGRLVDDADWVPTTHHCISEWGHHHPSRFKPRPPKLAGWPAPSGRQ